MKATHELHFFCLWHTPLNTLVMGGMRGSIPMSIVVQSAHAAVTSLHTSGTSQTKLDNDNEVVCNHAPTRTPIYRVYSVASPIKDAHTVYHSGSAYTVKEPPANKDKGKSS